MESGVQAFVPAVDPRGSVAKPYHRHTTEGEETAVGPGLGTGRRGSVNGPTDSLLRHSVVVSLSVPPPHSCAVQVPLHCLWAELYSRASL